MKYFAIFIFLILGSSCSSLSIDKEATFKERIIKIFANNYEEVNLIPKDVTKFDCENNEFFYLKYLEENNAVWVILKNREFRLDKIEGLEESYANSTTTIDIKESSAVIRIDTAILYKKCQQRPYKT